MDASVPNPARMYDFLLGGKDNFAVDRAAAREILSAFPAVRRAAQANRGFLVRALWFLAAQGIRQYIDLGTGFPTPPNVHEVTRQVIPDARIAYVDYDRVVTAHNQALQATTPGVVAVQGDIRHPGEILGDPDLPATKWTTVRRATWPRQANGPAASYDWESGQDQDRD